MKPTTRFSLVVFAPLFIAFMAPALFLLPASVLMTLLSVLDASLAITEVADYGFWVLSPTVAALGLLFMGNRLHSLYARGRSHTMAWIGTWAVFAIALFGALWFGMTIVTSIGASDYATGEFLRWTATVAALITLVLQPGVGLWLHVTSRILRRVEPAHRVEQHTEP